MDYPAKDFSKLIGTPGFSNNLLENHFTLYQGYVANTQKLAEVLNRATKEGKASTPEFAELKRRFGWEWNGMSLHELYFENLGGDGNSSSALSASAIIKSAFGSFDQWQDDFKSTAMMRGIGWVVLYYDRETKNAFNCWINEHDVGHLTGAISLLVMDVFEHAYITDYGLKKADYIDAFITAIDWPVVESRVY